MSPETATHSSEPASPAVAFTDVTCRIGTRTVLEQANLSIPRGSVAGILGANGAGKTTLLGAVSGLRPASSGTVTVLGETQTGRELSLRRRMGVVFQETALHDELTTTENLEFAASLYDIPEPKQRISDVLDLLGLTDRARERVGRLSGGLRRRVTLARALLHDPELLIAAPAGGRHDGDCVHKLLRRGTGTLRHSFGPARRPGAGHGHARRTGRPGRVWFGRNAGNSPARLACDSPGGLPLYEVSVFLGGGFTTIAFLPAWLRLVSAFNPARYAIDGLRQTLFYRDLTGFGVDLAVLTGAAFVAAALGAVAVRR